MIVVLLCGSAAAQENKPTSDPRARDAELRQKAFDLLESLAGDVGTLQSSENRARLGSNLAALLWDHDEKRARSLLLAVETDIKTGFQKLDKSDRANALTGIVFLKLRSDTAKRISERDAETAIAFLAATEPDNSTEEDNQFSERERELKLQLAKDLVSRKPEIAVKLARQSLAQGFSNELLLLLRRLQRQDKEQSQMLYKEIVSKLRDEELSPGVPASYFAISLARAFKPPAVDEQTFRELIQLFITAALSHGCGKKRDENDGDWFCSELASMISEMEKVDPSRAAQLKQWAPDESEGQSSYGREAYQEIDSLGEDSTVDDILALAEKYPSMKDQIYWKAFEKAAGAGDLERARKIASEVRDDYIHRLMVRRLESADKIASLNEQQLADIQTTLNRISNAEGRVSFLLNVASRVGTTDRKTALKLIDQAADITDSMKSGRGQTYVQMLLAIMYCQEQSDRGLAIMQTVMPTLNQLISAAAKLDGYDTHNLREGEWNMSNQGEIGALLTQLSQNAGYFAWYDFDRSVDLAGQFERPEIRLMAQLKLAQAILAGPPKRVTLEPMNYINVR